MTTLSASMKSDRRVRRTRQLLANALFTLMKEKSYNDITVKELCEAADINRGTFYLHYKDIDDMVEQIEQEILAQFEALICAHAPASPDDAPDRLFLDMFRFAEENRDLYAALLGKNGDLSFLRKIKEMSRRRLMELYADRLPEKDLVRFDYFYSFISSGCIGLIEHWLFSPNPEPAAKIAALATDLVIGGMRPTR